jgi:hypothetical protein
MMNDDWTELNSDVLGPEIESELIVVHTEIRTLFALKRKELMLSQDFTNVPVE